MGYLVDANVLCEATRLQPASNVVTWLERHDAELHISTLTLAEILKGIHLLAPGKKRRQLELWFEELVASFTGRILPVDEAVARTCAEFYARQQQQGRLLSSFDSLLAATAIAQELTSPLATPPIFPRKFLS